MVLISGGIKMPPSRKVTELCSQKVPLPQGGSIVLSPDKGTNEKKMDHNVRILYGVDEWRCPF
jgi:hypothetical protein